jgi:hypothetical protein
VLRQVEPDIRVAGAFDGQREEPDPHSHRHPRVGIAKQHSIDAGLVEKRRGIVSKRGQSGDKRQDCAYGETRLEVSIRRRILLQARFGPVSARIEENQPIAD